MNRLRVFTISHDTYAGGGRKSHVIDLDTGRVLCGHQGLGFIQRWSLDAHWLNQPDPDGEICQKCKCAALKRLQNQ